MNSRMRRRPCEALDRSHRGCCVWTCRWHSGVTCSCLRCRTSRGATPTSNWTSAERPCRRSRRRARGRGAARWPAAPDRARRPASRPDEHRDLRCAVLSRRTWRAEHAGRPAQPPLAGDHGRGRWQPRLDLSTPLHFATTEAAFAMQFNSAEAPLVAAAAGLGITHTADLLVAEYVARAH